MNEPYDQAGRWPAPFSDEAVEAVGWKLARQAEELVEWLGINEHVLHARYAKEVWNTHYQPFDKYIQFGELCVRDCLFLEGRGTHDTELVTWMRPVLEHVLGQSHLVHTEVVTTHLVIHEVAHALDHSWGTPITNWKTYVYAPGSTTAIKESGDENTPVSVSYPVCGVKDAHGPSFREAVSEIWCDHGKDLVARLDKVISEHRTKWS